MIQQEIAEYTLENLKKAGADKAACTVTRGRKEEFNVEAGKFSLLRTLFDDELVLKAICSNKKGVTAINKLDKDSIDKAVKECVSLAHSSIPDEAEDIAEKVENKTFDHGVSGPDMDGLFLKTKEFIEQAGDEYPKLMLENVISDYNTAHTTYLNSNGVEFHESKEYYNVSTLFSAGDGEKASSFNYYDAALKSPDIPFLDLGMHRTLIDESVRSLDTRMVDNKFVGKVIVTPACDDMVWGTIFSCFLTDRPLVEGTSRWKDALGSKVADSKLTVRLAPLNPGVIAGERITSDGYESQNIDIIREGILSTFLLSLYGSRKTGHPRAGSSAYHNIEVASGNTSLADMIKSIDRGILLNRFSGASPGPSGDISGVAKNSFLIENGAVTDAISETMVSFNIVDILANIPAISKERCENGRSILPWCCFDGVTISGR